MIDFRNPYTPGAGVTPQYLAGRDKLIDDARQRIETVAGGYQARSIVYFGLRGVGKTVILNAVENIAEENDLLYKHIEVKESSDFTKLIAIACNGFVQNLSLKEKLKNKAGKLFSVIKSFSAKWNPEDKTVSFGLQDTALECASAGTGNLSNDLTELMVTLGKYAKEADAAISFCVDEIQYAKNEELEAFVTAIHRVNQLGLPMIFFCAGLPKIRKTMGDTKSYTERLFEFIEVDSLTKDAARDAIVVPAEKLGVHYAKDAVNKIIEITQGYPYFIQEMCSIIWHNGDTNLISIKDVIDNIGPTNEKLDAGFFHVRYDRCTKSEKLFMTAMVKCGKLPCTIANVAQIMGREVKSISINRSNLINKGLIYATGHGEINFTVPQFDAFIKRAYPDLE